jgi:hypothetical protein
MLLSYEKAYALHGIKLIRDFRYLTVLSLEKLIASLQFLPFSSLDEENVYNYTSQHFHFPFTTFLLTNDHGLIYKVRYLDCNFRLLLAQLSLERECA